MQTGGWGLSIGREELPSLREHALLVSLRLGQLVIPSLDDLEEVEHLGDQPPPTKCWAADSRRRLLRRRRVFHDQDGGRWDRIGVGDLPRYYP